MCKKSKYIALLLIVNLFLCAYTTRGTSMVVQEVKENYDTGYNSFNTVKLEGEYVTLPCNFKLIQNLGYELETSDKSLTIPAQSFYTMIYAYNDYGDTLTLDFVNSTDKEKSIVDCDVYEITMDVNGNNKTSISIDINGVELFTAIDGVKSVLGDPKYVSDKYNNVYTASWNTEKYDRDIMLSFIDGVGMIGIHVTVEMPADVEYYDSYSTDYRHESGTLPETDYRPEHKKESGIIVVFGVLAIITFIIANVGVVVLVLLHRAKSHYSYIDDDKVKLDKEVDTLDTKIEVPEDSYLDEKYKDYL